MVGPSVRRHGQLQEKVGTVPGNADLLRDLIETVYRIRYVRLPVAQTTLTIDKTHLGACILVTAATAVTITLPANAGTSTAVGNGFLTTIEVLGAGSVTIAGTHVGGSTVATNGISNIQTLDDGSWFVTGAS